MQEIIYIQPGGSRYDPDTSITITSRKRPETVYIINSPTGLGAVGVNLQTSDAAGKNGAYLQGATLEPRQVADTITIRGRTREEMYAARDKLERILSPLAGEGTLIYRNDAGEWTIPAIASVYGDAQARIARNFCRVGVSFYSADPLWREDMTSDVLLYRYARGDALPVTFPTQLQDTLRAGVVYNGGSAPAQPDFAIAGPLTGVSIECVTTGEIINFPALSLDAGDVATVNGAGLRTTVFRAATGRTEQVVPEYGFTYPSLPLLRSSWRVGVDWADAGASVRMRFKKLFVGV